MVDAHRQANGASADAEQVSNDETVVKTLFALAHPARLSIIRQTDRPRALSEIEVDHANDGGRRKRLSRQAVKEHVARLVEAGLLSTVPDPEDRRHRVRYVLNQQRMYAAAETVRGLSRLRGAGEPDETTLAAGTVPSPFDLRAQSLVMVKGPDEGRVFPLPAPADGEREWLVGRSRGVDVELGHDGHVSGHNSVISWRGGAYFVEDLPSSRNGTQLNFQPLEPGQRERLRTGDLVSVGRTILMFRA